MPTELKSPTRICALAAAVSLSLLTLTACDRDPSDAPMPTSSSERMDNTARIPAMPPATPVPPLPPVDATTTPAGQAPPTGGPTGTQ
jgi:hypothetical protein